MSTRGLAIDVSEAQVQQLLNTLEAQVQNVGQKDAILQLRQEMERRSRAQQWLHQREQAFETLVEHAPDVIARFDRRFRFVYANPAIQEQTGRVPEQCIGKTHREIGFPPAVCELWEAKLREAFDTNRRMAFDSGGLSAAGGEQTCEVRLVPEASSTTRQVETVLSVSREVTAPALRQDRDRLELALEAGQAGMVQWDLRTNKAWWNAYAYRIHGYAPDSFEPTYEFWLSRLHSDDRKRVEAEIATCLGERRSELACEYRIIRPSDEVRWVRGVGRFWFDANGAAESFTGIALDITEQKQAEKASQESDAALRSLKEANIIGIIQGEEQRITYANDLFLRMVGHSREELEANQLSYPQITPQEYAPLDEQAVRDLAATGAAKPFEKEYFRKDGSRVPVLLGIAALGNAPLRWICFVMDLTEQKRFEAERTKLAALVQNSNDFIGIADIDGTALFLNAGGRRLVGLDLEGPLPPVEEYLFPEDRAFYVREVLPKMLQEGRWVGEFTFRHFKTHEPVSVLWDCFAVSDPKTGKPMCLATVTRDIREEKRSQAAIRRSMEAAERASQAKDQFIAALSHELRTPLTPILAAVQMMEEDPHLPSEHLDAIKMVQRNVALEARLIDDLLDLTRISRGKLELHLAPVDMHSLLRHVVDICDSDMRSKQLQFTVELTAAHHDVLGDTARLQQVVWNLLKNAVKFTPAGGSISLRTDQPAEGRLAITLSDTGIGIESELLPRIFNAFEQGDRTTTRHFGGLGLGLAISKGIVDLHGGTLTARSQGKDLGATFTMELATSSAAELHGPRGTKPSGEHARRKSGRLLLVEDHPDTRTMMARVLRKQGYEVRTADSVAEALRSAGMESFDLMLCDIGLPDGSGLDLMRQLMATNRSTKAIALSGFGMEEDINKSRQAGFIEHLTKPIDLKLLEEAMERALQGQDDGG